MVSSTTTRALAEVLLVGTLGTLLLIFAAAFIFTVSAYRRKSLKILELKEKLSKAERMLRPTVYPKRGKTVTLCDACVEDKWPCETVRALRPGAGRPDVSAVMRKMTHG